MCGRSTPKQRSFRAEDCGAGAVPCIPHQFSSVVSQLRVHLPTLAAD